MGESVYVLGGYVVRRASLWERVRYRRRGWRLVGFATRPGWRGELPLYQRGGKIAYPRGYEGRLE